jgi:hypothetical protein
MDMADSSQEPAVVTVPYKSRSPMFPALCIVVMLNLQSVGCAFAYFLVRPASASHAMFWSGSLQR